MKKTGADPAPTPLSQPAPGELFLIIGMHRSGTSIVGQLLHRFNFYFGNNLISKMNGVNDSGFWEDKTVVEINEQIFHLLGSSWYSFLRLPDGWQDLPEMHDCYAAIDDWYVKNFYGKTPAIIKDPRLCRLFPIWNAYLNQKCIKPRVIFVFRNPESVALSLKKRDQFSRMTGYLLWLVYMVEAMESIVASEAPCTRICYDKLVASPLDIIDSVLNNDFRDVQYLKRPRVVRLAHLTIDPVKNHYKLHEIDNSVQLSSYGRLAFDLYNDLTSASVDMGLLAKTYRARLDELFNQSADLLMYLQEELNSHVTLSKKLAEIGPQHSLALDVISKKDKKFERYSAEMEKKISGNKSYIRKCQARIRDQDALLATLGKKAEISDNLAKAVLDREAKIAQNVEYIKKCENRIREQDQMIARLKKWTLIWPVLRMVKRVMIWIRSKIMPVK